MPTATEFEGGTALSPPSAQRVASFEQSFRVQLPAAFRELLAIANGARPIRNAFDQGRRVRVIERYLPLIDAPKNSDDGWYDIASVITQIDERLIGPECEHGTNLVPIAALFAGDFVCLDYRVEAAVPAVVVWDHEQSTSGKPSTEMVAATFSEFFNLTRRAAK